MYRLRFKDGMIVSQVFSSKSEATEVASYYGDRPQVITQEQALAYKQEARSMTFKELQVGDIFDFINDEQPSLTSFWSQCKKISARMYESTETHTRYRVGSVHATVFHVRSRKAVR